MEVKDEEISSLEVGEDSFDRLRVTPIGYNGLRISAGTVQEDCQRELAFPYSLYTYNKMLTDGAVGPAIEYVQLIIHNVPWRIVAPQGYEEELKDRVQYLNTVMKDMEHSWLDFIKQATSYIPMGFAPFEVVPRRRVKTKGSKYNDGLWGIRKIALRSQDTITGVDYKNNGRDFNGFWQRVNQITNRSTYRNAFDANNELTGQDVLIPSSRLLNFRNNPVKDSPLGKSPLNAVYMSWRYKKAYEENLAHGIAQDVHGLKILEIPPEYMKEDSTPEQKAVYEMYKRIMRDVHIGKESGIILPRAFSQGGQEYFKFHVVSVSGQKAYNVLEVINHYNREILTGLYAEFLTVGQGGGGSFGLAESKSTTVQQVVESKLAEIKNVLCHVLIPMLWKWNGWEQEVLPEFIFGEVNIVDLETFSKAIQRIGAVKLIPRTAKNVNAICEKLNLPDRVSEDATQDELDKVLGSPPAKSKSGQGMTSGMNNGTGDSTGSGGDSSTGNSENS